MGRTAVNFTFDIQDIDLTTSPTTVIDKANGHYKQDTSHYYGIFSYETNEYIVPAGKRLIFRVSFNYNKLNAKSTFVPTTVQDLINFLRDLDDCSIIIPGFYRTDWTISEQHRSPDTGEMYISQSIGMKNITPILIAPPGSKIKLRFQTEPTGIDDIYSGRTTSEGATPLSQTLLLPPQNKVMIFPIDFSTSLTTINSSIRDPYEDMPLTQLSPTLINMNNNNIPITSTLWRKGIKEVGWLNGFLEDDI